MQIKCPECGIKYNVPFSDHEVPTLLPDGVVIVVNEGKTIAIVVAKNWLIDHLNIDHIKVK